MSNSIKNGEQLNDSHINAADCLLQGQFTEIQGLASPVLRQKLCFPTFNDILANHTSKCCTMAMITG